MEALRLTDAETSNSHCSQTRPLKSIPLKSRPLTSHCLAWSCDAELAVATDDVIYIFLPEYPKGGLNEVEDEGLQQQYTLLMRAIGLIKPDPSLNAQLCAQHGVRIAVPKVGDENWFPGVGTGQVTGTGGSVCQTIRLEWSPNGLGCNLRPILTALSTAGAIFALGENIDLQSTVISGMRTRSFKAWKALWGLGAHLPLPDSAAEDGHRLMEERIQSFSWAKEISNGRALLAYSNDAGEIVIMSIQLYSKADPSSTTFEDEPQWDIREVVRFGGQGPHVEDDAADFTNPDYVAHGSPFALKWSPWSIGEGKRTAALAYLAKNYVGFRKVTIQGDWIKGELPKIEVATTDMTAICMQLSPNAFIDWEDTVCERVARGVIGTPFDVKPFQVPFSDGVQEAAKPHSTWDCSTTYTNDENQSTNPITGLTLHPRDKPKESQVPYYSLTRLSATSTNQDWFQTNLPDPNSTFPQWATKIRTQTTQLMSRAMALEGLDSDSSDSEDEVMDDYGLGAQVHPYRFRIWGMASSPGGGTTAAIISKYSTQHPHRRAASKLVFGWRDEKSTQHVPDKKGLTTEARLWEWMYGGADEVPGTTEAAKKSAHAPQSQLREQFEGVFPKQRCVFCDSALQVRGDEVKCSSGHEFARCAATGLAILAPDISRICAVCELRCLKVSELQRVAEEYIGPGTVVGSSGEVCGGCGGKFVA